MVKCYRWIIFRCACSRVFFFLLHLLVLLMSLLILCFCGEIRKDLSQMQTTIWFMSSVHTKCNRFRHHSSNEIYIFFFPLLKEIPTVSKNNRSESDSIIIGNYLMERLIHFLKYCKKKKKFNLNYVKLYKVAFRCTHFLFKWRQFNFDFVWLNVYFHWIEQWSVDAS